MAAALHTRVFGVRRAAANEGIFIPHWVLYVLRSNCPTLPVKLDYPFAHRRAVARSRHFRRITLRLFDFSRRLGDTRDQCHYQRLSLKTTYYKLLERGSVRTLWLARALFEGVNDALPMEALNLVIDDTLIPRQSEKAPDSIIRHDHARKHNPGAMLGYVGRQRAGRCGQEVCVPIVFRLCPALSPSPAIATS